MGRIDFSRVAGVYDPDIMSTAAVALIGAGGGRRKAELLAHVGVGALLIVDPDTVDERNPTTQAHREIDIGKPKAAATAQAVNDINSAVKIKTVRGTWEDAVASEGGFLAKADQIIAATDSYQVNRSIRRYALKQKRDLIEAWIYPEGSCVEHVVTWTDVVAAGGGCGTCHTKGRLDAVESGFENPRFVPTHILAAELSCVQTVLILLSRLHARAGSALPISHLAERMKRKPFLLTRLDPSFWSLPGEPFSDTPDGYDVFLSRSYELDSPFGWACPDCGSQRNASPAFSPAVVMPHLRQG